MQIFKGIICQKALFNKKGDSQVSIPNESLAVYCILFNVLFHTRNVDAVLKMQKIFDTFPPSQPSATFLNSLSQGSCIIQSAITASFFFAIVYTYNDGFHLSELQVLPSMTWREIKLSFFFEGGGLLIRMAGWISFTLIGTLKRPWQICRCL